MCSPLLTYLLYIFHHVLALFDTWHLTIQY